MSVSIEFYGHACIGLFFEDGPTLCVDPYDPTVFENFNELDPIREEFDYVLSTHEHADHAAFGQFQKTRLVESPYQLDGLAISHFEAFHDEYRGALRDGTTRLTSIRYGGLHVVHTGDLGERLTCKQLNHWNPGPVDLLALPVGGYFTLGPDGAYELTKQLEPRWVLPVHAREHGIALPDLQSSDAFTERFAPAMRYSPPKTRHTLKQAGISSTQLLTLSPSRKKPRA